MRVLVPRVQSRLRRRRAPDVQEISCYERAALRSATARVSRMPLTHAPTTFDSSDTELGSKTIDAATNTTVERQASVSPIPPTGPGIAPFQPILRWDDHEFVLEAGLQSCSARRQLRRTPRTVPPAPICMPIPQKPSRNARSPQLHRDQSTARSRRAAITPPLSVPTRTTPSRRRAVPMHFRTRKRPECRARSLQSSIETSTCTQGSLPSRASRPQGARSGVHSLHPPSSSRRGSIFMSSGGQIRVSLDTSRIPTREGRTGHVFAPDRRAGQVSSREPRPPLRTVRALRTPTTALSK